MNLSICSMTDVGKVRDNNEDAFYEAEINIHTTDGDEKVNIFTVLDGMGGLDKGEEASAIAGKIYTETVIKSILNLDDFTISTDGLDEMPGGGVEYPKRPYYEVNIKSFSRETSSNITLVGKLKQDYRNYIKDTLSSIKNAEINKDEQTKNEQSKKLFNNDLCLTDGIKTANDSIKEAFKGQESPGTTIISGLIYNENLIITNLGDSRAYIYRTGDSKYLNEKAPIIERLSKDHSYVQALVDIEEITEEEARVHPNSAVLTKCLGCDRDDVADFTIVGVRKGDIYILSSDGLHDMLSDKDIDDVLANNKGDIKKIAITLVNKAKESGGSDNITVSVIEVL